MPVIRAQVRLPFVTGVPEDVATNTLYFFAVGGAGAPEVADIANRLDAYYSSVGTFLSSIIDRPNASVRFYDMSDAEPRVPFGEEPVVVASAGVSSSLPSEVSVVHSFRAIYTSGQPPARRRGRIYLGPLATNAGTAVANSAARPAAAFITAIGNGGAALGNDSGTTGTRWSVYSPTDNASLSVIEQWINNEFDTQRRRGLAATERNASPVTQP